MAQLLVLSDLVGADHAMGLVARFRGLGVEVEHVERKKFPIADSMSPILGRLAEQADVCIAVISDHHNAKNWIAREILNNRALYPSWFLAYAPGVADGSVTGSDDPRILLPEHDPMDRIGRAFGVNAPKAPAGMNGFELPPLSPDWVPFDSIPWVKRVMRLMPERLDVAHALGHAMAALWRPPALVLADGRGPHKTQEVAERLIFKEPPAATWTLEVLADGHIASIAFSEPG